MKTQGRRQSSNVADVQFQSAAVQSSRAQSTYKTGDGYRGTPTGSEVDRTPKASYSDYSNSDMAVQAGIKSMDAAAAHDAQSTGTFTRKQTTPPLKKAGRTRWNEN